MSDPVPCKCRAAHRSAGSDVVRNREEAIRLADEGSVLTSNGMVITTSTFTAGVVSAAASFGVIGIELIDGSFFAKMMPEASEGYGYSRRGEYREKRRLCVKILPSHRSTELDKTCSLCNFDGLFKLPKCGSQRGILVSP